MFKKTLLNIILKKIREESSPIKKASAYLRYAEALIATKVARWHRPPILCGLGIINPYSYSNNRMESLFEEFQVKTWPEKCAIRYNIAHIEYQRKETKEHNRILRLISKARLYTLKAIGLGNQNRQAVTCLLKIVRLFMSKSLQPFKDLVPIQAKMCLDMALTISENDICCRDQIKKN